VAFISLRDNLDLSTPSGRLMMHIIGAMAQIERELIEERVSAGMHAARRRSGRIGRPQTYANANQIRALRAQDVPGKRSQRIWASAPVLRFERFKTVVLHDGQLSSHLLNCCCGVV
jgi:DNA invertase Pin-like site-specific DNA recombinase